MDMKHLSRYLFMTLLMLTVFGGCRSKQAVKGEDSLRIYYKNLAYSGISSYSCSPLATERDALVKELWTRLTESDQEEDRISVVPEGLELTRYMIESSNIDLYFNDAYQDMDTVEELLFRAAMVRTFTQLEGIESVTFFADEKPVTNSSYAPLGAQKSADYVDIIGNGLSNVRRTTITLHYTNENADALVKRTQEVVYESSYSIEKDVVKRLIDGPQEDGLYRTLPSGLQLISISVKDKICYVNFDTSFITDALSIDGNIIVYSVVNSLTELPEIQKVQIMVNGESNIIFRDINLSSPLERNLNY